MTDTAIKNIKGFSSAYPNMCDLKLLPNIDGNWITIQDNVGTSMTIKLSDLSKFICLKGVDKAIEEIKQDVIAHSGTGEQVIQAYCDGLAKALKYLENIGE